MQDKNRRLAKENNQLKSLITQKTQLQEEILKKTIKSEYTQILTYKQMLESIECGIDALEDALERCKRIKDVIINNKKLLSDITNLNKGSKSDFRNENNNMIEKNRTEYKKNEERDTLDNSILDEIIKEKHETKNSKNKTVRDSLFDKWN